VNGALDVAASQERQRVACVDRDGPVLWLHPLPLVLHVVPDLEGRYRLTEEERPRAEIGVPAAPGVHLGILLGRELRVLHVSEVVF
jgi:hypothetical protein